MGGTRWLLEVVAALYYCCDGVLPVNHYSFIWVWTYFYQYQLDQKTHQTHHMGVVSNGYLKHHLYPYLSNPYPHTHVGLQTHDMH